MALEPGTIVRCTITGTAKFGAFVSIEGGGSGLIHISEIRNGFVADVTKYLKIGDVLDASVLSVDERGRVSLTLKFQKPVTSAPEEYTSDDNPSDFEDMMTRFKANSTDKLVDLKHKNEGTRRKNRK